MPFELEALVGHLYMVGGKTIKTQPPGTLVEVAPRRAARGRETDTFFVLVLPSGTIAPNTFYEQMAQMCAERFFGMGGSVTAALRETLNSLNNNLFEHNQSGRTHYEASMICGVLRDDELYLARVGAAAAVLRVNDELLTYPEELTNDETLFQPPLGVQPIPVIHMKRFLVTSNARFCLCDANISEVKAENLKHALSASDLEQVLNELKIVILSQIQCLAVELVPPETPVDLPVAVGESTSAIAAQLASVRQKVATQTTEAAGVTVAPPAPPVIETTKRAAGSTAQSIGRSFLALGELAGKLFARPIHDPRPRFSTRFLIAAVVALPAFTALVVVMSWVLQVGVTEFEQCVAQVNQNATFARSLDSSQVQSLRVAWQGTLDSVEACLKLRSDDAALLALREEGRALLDRLNLVRRRPLTLVAALPNTTARIQSLVLQGLDLYALDGANSLVYRLQVGADGVTAVTLPQPITSMRQGAVVDGLGVTNILDIAYDDLENALVAVDRSGVLIRCLPNFINQCDGQRLLASENWQNPVKIAIWQGRLYVLDTAGNQLWRYDVISGNYSSNPTEYFAGQVRPNLLNAVDFDITTSGIGRIYMLFGDGVMTSYITGDPEPFAFGFPEGISLSEIGAQGLFMDDSPISQSFYIFNQPTRTVYETTLAGTFIARYRPTNEEDWTLLSDVVVESSQRILYAASGNAIFAMRLGDAVEGAAP